MRALDAALDEGEVADEVDGCCQMCSRHKPLTFHHLIPKDTHSKYIGKSLPSGVEEAALVRWQKEQNEKTAVCPGHFVASVGPTKKFLNTWGAMLCRSCHSQVHRTESNTDLAQVHCQKF